jgi:hypothetical protein
MMIRTERLLALKNGAAGSAAANAPDADIARGAGANGLSVEMPRSLPPHGHRCGITFDIGGTATIVLGMRDFGHGYASPYFASVAVRRLGIPFNRIRLYYAGVHPAAKIGHWNVANIPSRVSVGPVNAQIGDLIEALCDRVIEEGRRFLSMSIGVPLGEIEFDVSSGQFSVAGNNGHLDILEVAERARHGGPAY